MLKWIYYVIPESSQVTDYIPWEGSENTSSTKKSVGQA